jgi:DNA processing protein
VQETADLLALTLVAGFSPRIFAVLRARGPVKDVLAHPGEHADVLSPGACRQILSGDARRRAGREAAEARARGFRIIGFDEPDYPPLLRTIYDPPPVLYLRGALVESPKAVAVVGCRGASSEGRVFARELGRGLASAGVTVVSGLARGIDAAAHEGALAGDGPTIAILGSGLDRVYPEDNASLAEAVCQDGALISEFPLGTPPFPGNFPRRNRVIAGWVRMVVVVEAGRRSGALLTARLALDEGREVAAVPGHPSREVAQGTNGLLRDGAVLVRGVQDILDEMGWEGEASADDLGHGDALLELLPVAGACTFEELQARSGRPPSELLARLSALELDRRVRRLPGSMYARN